jgi:hypothetical protein
MVIFRMLLCLVVVNVCAAGTLTVCEALEKLPDLKGSKVHVRGVWLIGDTGNEVWAVTPCGKPITRDGWTWPREGIAVAPRGGMRSVMSSPNLSQAEEADEKQRRTTA